MHAENALWHCLSPQLLQGTCGVQELNQKVEDALACPCLDDLKEGPCGKSFIAAFSCFLKSQATEKVSAGS